MSVQHPQALDRSQAEFVRRASSITQTAPCQGTATASKSVVVKPVAGRTLG